MGYNLYRITPEERQAIESYEAHGSAQALDTAFDADVSKLRDLRQGYARVDLPIAIHSAWGSRGATDTQADFGFGEFVVDLRYFRGDNVYVWSCAPSDPLAARLRYFIYADAVRRKDAKKLLNSLGEDGAFGCITFEFPGLGRVSRDLMDSVVEINFLHKHLNILARDDLRVLDIGAGYGRMAHRMLSANPRIKSYTCVDAVPESTFLCDYYLKHRGLQDRAQVIPMNALEQRLKNGSYDLAMNIHSFSECTYAAIEWWLLKLQKLGVRHLLIVPNHFEQFLSTEPNHERRDFAPLLKQIGYREIAREPVLDDAAVRGLLGVDNNMFLFELS